MYSDCTLCWPLTRTHVCWVTAVTCRWKHVFTVTTFSGDHRGQYRWIEYQQFESRLQNVRLLASLYARKTLGLADSEWGQIVKEPNYTEISTSLILAKKTSRFDQSSYFTYLLTYSMVQSPSWEANWFAASQEIPRISCNPKVYYRTHKRPPPVSILGQSNPVNIPTSHLLEIHPNIIHPYTPSSPQWSPSLQFPQQDPIHTPLLTHTRHMPSPSQSALIAASNWLPS